MTDCELKDLCSQFQLSGEFVSGKPYGEGHINDTYCITVSDGNQYILQSVNSEVFKQPEDVMDNIILILDFLHKKIAEQGGDPYRETMTLVPANDGKYYITTKDGMLFRVYRFITDAVCCQTIDNPEIFYQTGKSFGHFQKMLADFPTEKLKETIPNFHNTYQYFLKFENAVREDCLGRCAEVSAEIEFVRNHLNDTTIVMNAIEAKEIPLRVTHNDTKLNNIMFDRDNGQGVCVIDLDTVMPGSLIFDFGDSIRFGANTAAEDEIDLQKVSLDLELFERYTRGFLEELSDSISERELKLLAFSAKLLTLECGIRFLTDYLVGDTYFKIHRPKHNLDRARTQFKLVSDIEEKMPDMEKIVRNIYATIQ